MEDLLGLFIAILALVGSLISKAAKNGRAARRPASQGHPYVRPLDAPPPIPEGVPVAKTAPAPVQTVMPLPVREMIAPQMKSAEGLSKPPVRSGEGVDPCHEEMLEPAVRPASQSPTFPTTEEKPGLTLEWTGDAMVKAFVMQEVLRRPCQRRGVRA